MLRFSAVIVLLCSVQTFSQSSISTPTPCQNTIDDCYFHRRDEICQGIYKAWASVRCARYCGFCTGPGPEEKCEDTLPNCQEYKPCDDPAYFVWVAGHCRKYCGVCGSTATQVTQAQSTPIPGGNSHASSSSGNHVTSSIPSSTTQKLTRGTTLPSITGRTTLPSTPGAVNQASSTTKDVAPESTTRGISAGPTTDAVSTERSTTGAITTSPQTVAASTQRSTTGHTTPGGSVSSSCTDVLPYCSQYSRDACSDKDWATQYCSHYCLVCDLGTSTPASGKTSASGSTSPTLPPSCIDAISWCQQYSREACSDIQWGKTYCQRYCGLCSS